MDMSDRKQARLDAKTRKAKRELLLEMEETGGTTVRSAYRSRWEAAGELIADGWAVLRSHDETTLRLGRVIEAAALDAYQRAIGRTPAQTGDYLAQAALPPLNADQLAQVVDAVFLALLPRVNALVAEALQRPQTEAAFDADLRAAIGTRTGFEMSAVLGWLGVPDEQPARMRVGLALARLGFRRVTKNRRHLYLLPADAGPTYGDFVARVAAAVVDFSSVSLTDAAAMIEEPDTHATKVRIGRALGKLGWKKRTRGAHVGEREVYYVRS